MIVNCKDERHQDRSIAFAVSRTSCVALDSLHGSWTLKDSNGVYCVFAEVLDIFVAGPFQKVITWKLDLRNLNWVVVQNITIKTRTASTPFNWFLYRDLESINISSTTTEFHGTT